MSAASLRLPPVLPPLRDGLQLHAAAPQGDGSPAWVIQDPVTNAFYRVGWLAFEMLSRWTLGTPAQVLQSTASETLLRPSEDELADLYQFLLGHQLLAVHDARYTGFLEASYRRGHLGRARWLLHHYLFFRVPLLRPADALRRMMPWLGWLFRRAAAWSVLALGAVGLLLTARQWDSFSASFVDTLTPAGLWGYLLALAVTKSLHELGHALAATRYGVRVAHMGVAFVVLWPMLYTDTGEAWRLSSRRQRLVIASAGIVTELAVAALATLAWNLAPDASAMKQSLFFLASTAWLVSLALNASPFMRFDGYFIVSDALDMPNLHERAFALALTSLRNTLLGWNDPDPESLRPGRRRALVAFAYATWLYRLVVFAGIAVAVYLFFFKLLGLFLFAVEIAWFIVRPVRNELREWSARRNEITPGRRLGGALLGAAMLLAALVPWSGRIDAHGWAQPQQVHTFYSPLPARLLTSAPAGREVAAGGAVFELTQPEIGLRAELSRSASEALQQRLQGLGGEERGEERRTALIEQQAMRDAEWLAQSEEADRLTLRAPFAGVLVDIDPELAPGVWVLPRQPLAVLVSPQRWQAEAFVPQQSVSRLKAGDTVRFHPDAGSDRSPLHGKVVDIAATRTTTLPHAMLSGQHGGPIAVLQDASGLAPREALYRVRIQLDGAPRGLQVMRGVAVIDGEARSWLGDVLKPMLVVIARELSF